MPLHPHLHLLIPSSNPSILLETRLYLPCPKPSSLSSFSALLSTSSSSDTGAIRHTDLTLAARDELKELGIQRVITAAHPWGRLGGNILDPVLSHHLVQTVFSRGQDTQSTKRTAVIAYNVRGVGESQGSSAWITPGNDPFDFAAVEQWALAAFGGSAPTEVCRFGYSWGCIAAVLAPVPPPTSGTSQLSSIMLISPPLSFVPAVTYFSGSFNAVLRGLMSNQSCANTSGAQTGTDGTSTEVWAIYGDGDQFTGVAKYRSWAGEVAGIQAKEVEGDHFWRDERQGQELRVWLGMWLSGGRKR